MSIQNQDNYAAYAALLRVEIEDLRESKRSMAIQSRCLTVVTLVAFAVLYVLLPPSSSIIILVLPLISGLLLFHWSNSERSYLDAEDRTTSLLLDLCRPNYDESDRALDENIASYLHKRIRTRSSATQFERTGYWLVLSFELAAFVAGYFFVSN